MTAVVKITILRNSAKVLGGISSIIRTLVEMDGCHSQCDVTVELARVGGLIDSSSQRSEFLPT